MGAAIARAEKRAAIIIEARIVLVGCLYVIDGIERLMDVFELLKAGRAVVMNDWIESNE